jgi:hypothetical protein
MTWCLVKHRDNFTPSPLFYKGIYDDVSISFRTDRLETGLQMIQLSATRRSCIAILWVSLVSFAAITLCVAFQRVFIVAVYFVIDSIRKLLDRTSYFTQKEFWIHVVQFTATYRPLSNNQNGQVILHTQNTNPNTNSLGDSTLNHHNSLNRW